MGNTESATSDEDEMADDLAMEDSHNEVIKVFQPKKLRDELENGKIKDIYSYCIKFPINHLYAGGSGLRNFLVRTN